MSSIFCSAALMRCWSAYMRCCSTSRCSAPVFALLSPRSMPRALATTSCSSLMSFSLSLRVFPVVWSSQSKTIWAWRLYLMLFVSSSLYPSSWCKSMRITSSPFSCAHSSIGLKSSSLVSSLIGTTPSRIGDHPATVYSFPVFLFILVTSLRAGAWCFL